MNAQASRLAEGLSGIPGVMVDPVHSNMVLAALPEASLAGIAEYMRSRDILILGASGGRIRMVTHLDIPEEAIDRVVDAFADYLS